MNASLPKQSPVRPTTSAKRSSRWVLFHGTSTFRLRNILKENRLRGAGPGATLSFTTDQSVAEYFSCVAIAVDKEDYPGSDPSGVVLRLDGEKLLARGYHLFAPISNPGSLEAVAKEWDPQNWDLENELLLVEDLAPLSTFLIDTIAVKRSTYDTFSQHGRPAFMPRVPFAAGVELAVMESLQHWGTDITPEEAESWILALRGIRDALTHFRELKRPAGEEGGGHG
jgi:hypothetical protein